MLATHFAYPDPTASALRSAISAAESVPPDHIFVGNGSDEVLAHLWFALLNGRAVQTLDTTYGFYPVWAGLYDSELLEVPVTDDFSVDLDALKESDAAIVLANPNAPTGRALSRGEVAAGHNQIIVLSNQRHGTLGTEPEISFIDHHSSDPHCDCGAHFGRNARAGRGVVGCGAGGRCRRDWLTSSAAAEHNRANAVARSK